MLLYACIRVLIAGLACSSQVPGVLVIAAMRPDDMSLPQAFDNVSSRYPTAKCVEQMDI